MLEAFEANTSLVVTVVYDAEESDCVRPRFLHRQGLLTPSRSSEREEIPARYWDLNERACEKTAHLGVSCLAPSISPCTISLADVCGPSMKPRHTLSQTR
jgi:hypothetical protein